MGKERPERITYAQKKLLDLIDRRELRSWCTEHNLPHTTVYRLALGESIATYAMICSMVHLIPPAEWIYYTDEKIPLFTMITRNYCMFNCMLIKRF